MKSVPLITGGLSFLLSACSGGGGSFDVDDVSNPSSSKPRYQDDTSSSRTKSNLQKLSIPSLGGGMKLVAQNLRDKNKPSLLNEDDYISYFSSLSTIKEDVNDKNKNGVDLIGSIDEPKAPNSNENRHGQKYVYSGLYYIPSWSLNDSKNNKFYLGYYGYAFYYGNKTATNLPVNGVAKYKGTWDFITATKDGQNYSLFSNARGQAYFRRSATRGDIDLENNQDNGETGLISEFSVDFGKKKLTGELYYNKRKTDLNASHDRKHKLYNLEADVYSNRFRGKVIPKEPESTEHPFTKEGTLEGGFYGPNAEELGGKFLAKDKKVFGVFSAKTPENQTLSKETLIDGKLITFSTKTTNGTTNGTTNTTTTNATTNAITNAENFKTEDIPSFGEADYLLIDNQPIPLLPEEKTNDFISSKHHTVGNKTYKVEACCSNLSYVKFGMYYEDPLKKEEEEEKDKQTTTTSINTYYQFLLGHRTASSKIPATGNVKYHGSWFGYISDGETSYSATGNKQQEKNAVAEFDVNFTDKTLKGQLKHADTQNTVFNIEAKFQKDRNDFTGTATAKDLVIDSNNSQGNTPINITTKVNGAFYGPHASELGGYFTYNGNPTAANSSAVPSPPNSEKARAAVVFGAKKQVETTKK
ncbi:transferrin-binding protein-like solute binding protein [Haemophilus influenzae]|uniref:transferrin-binding protein-like solute binding protein n=1 Tax=Haemophilus influenzae TaxID=727 RepID=UPI000E3415A6|nr:transferrin-binding protein-like solute binding protein [Haemophilus influenzae]AYO32744.1 transferrin-binding protein-like solute binding protein [Haemophilus influenzae]MCK9674562.1 transferrin-binding protein-like solute binding protein [Haemophilus influenzae]RFO05892.1 transferrin-binding protein-like solute binding protein [Haemophilus influenzae]